MNPEKFREIEALFHQARAHPPEQRSAFLDGACRGNPELRAEVESLLVHSAEEPADGSPPVEAPSELVGGEPIQEGPGSHIGPYKLLQSIGEGGFGAVYMADQKTPVKRRVALKIIKLGMDTKQVIARFEAERQALALMTHPNICRVFDGGATDTGRPYFVMELVKGISITEYCDGANLSTDERLKLFISVCNAVQHAHQKGVIHRDIKPSNVMVTLHDGEPVTKVIDFGIAKATNQELTEKTLFTEFRQFIGTPEYMSPEQAEMSGLDIDTRSDVYSLGVLLYELLTGTTPIDPKRLRSAAYGEIRRIIREEEPDKPSTRLSTLGEQLSSIARHRHAEAGVLRRSLRGDLDWIVMKALEKDRTRRYETASSFARDIERHLRHEPVTAGPPGTVYRLRKFLRRHRTGVMVASVMTFALVVGLALATAGFVQARRERDRAIEAEAMATREAQNARTAEKLQSELRQSAERAHRREAQQRALAEENAARVQREAEATESINDFFLDMLATADPMRHATLSVVGISEEDGGEVLGREETVPEMLRRASGRIPSAFADKPELEARVRETIGMTLEGMDHPLEAIFHLRSALDIRREVLGEDHPDTLRSRLQLATAFLGARDTAEARAVLEDHERLFGPDDRRTLVAARGLADLLRIQRRYDDAQVVFEETLERQRRVLGPEDPDTLVTMRGWAVHYLFQGRRDLARPLILEAYEITRRSYDEEHPLAIEARILRGLLLGSTDPSEEIESFFRELLEDCRRIYGDHHWVTRMTMIGLARSMDTIVDGEEMEQLLREVLPTYGASWQKMLGTKLLVCCLLDRKRFDEAIAILQAGAGPGISLEGTYDLGCALRLAGEEGRARECFERVLEQTYEQSQGTERSTSEFNDLSWCLLTLGDLSETDALEALEFAATAADGSPESGVVANTLGLAQYRAGLLTEALATLRWAEELESNPLNLIFLAMIHHDQGDAARAAELLEEARPMVYRNQDQPGIDTRMFLAEAEALLADQAGSDR